MDVPQPTPAAFAIGGPITRADLPGLCDRVCTLLEAADANVVLCDLRGVATDVVTVEALARLQLAARRRGCRVVLQHAPGDLRRLVAFLGLADVLVEREGATPRAEEAARTAGRASRCRERT